MEKMVSLNITPTPVTNEAYDKAIKVCKDLALSRNDRYGNSIDIMKNASVLDLVLMKLVRNRELPESDPKYWDEIIDSVNYLVYLLIRQQEKEQKQYSAPKGVSVEDSVTRSPKPEVDQTQTKEPKLSRSTIADKAFAAGVPIMPQSQVYLVEYLYPLMAINILISIDDDMANKPWDTELLNACIGLVDGKSSSTLHQNYISTDDGYEIPFENAPWISECLDVYSRIVEILQKAILPDNDEQPADTLADISKQLIKIR